MRDRERGWGGERKGERDRERGRDRETEKVRGQEIKVVRRVAKGKDRRGKMTADICTPIRQRQTREHRIRSRLLCLSVSVSRNVGEVWKRFVRSVVIPELRQLA